MNAKTIQNQLFQLTNIFPSCSVVNGEGQLLFSKDSKIDCLATTRLVAFQIVKKYLKPKPFDLIILNDPENGGFNLTKIIFFTTLNENLHLVWNEDLSFIDFKIPPTPLYENNQKNSFVWSALVENNQNAELLKKFFDLQKHLVDLIHLQTELIHSLSLSKNQNLWLKASQEIFEIQMNNKALGSAECSYRINEKQLIKLKLSLEERQNLKSITLDFTNTSLALDYSASSHVVESSLIQRLIQFYEVENFFTQVILDKIKIILPPKSIVSKSHGRGEWNSEIQTICTQLCLFNLNQLNSQTRRSSSHFELTPELRFDVINQPYRHSLSFDQKGIMAEDLERLITKNQFQLIICQRNEQNIHLKLEFIGDNSSILQLRSKLFSDNKDYFLKINDKLDFPRHYQLKLNDQIEILWKLR